MDLLNEVQDIFRDVFDDEELVIDDATSPVTVEDWDSMAQMSLMLSLQQHFKVKFTVEEIATLHDVGSILATLREKLA